MKNFYKNSIKNIYLNRLNNKVYKTVSQIKINIKNKKKLNNKYDK